MSDDKPSSFSFEELLELLIESGLKFDEFTSDGDKERRDWLMCNFDRKITDEQIEKLREHAELRFLSKGYIALKPKNSDLREEFGKEALRDD